MTANHKLLFFLSSFYWLCPSGYSLASSFSGEKFVRIGVKLIDDYELIGNHDKPHTLGWTRLQPIEPVMTSEKLVHYDRRLVSQEFSDFLRFSTKFLLSLTELATTFNLKKGTRFLASIEWSSVALGWLSSTSYQLELANLTRFP